MCNLGLGVSEEAPEVDLWEVGKPKTLWNLAFEAEVPVVCEFGGSTGGSSRGGHSADNKVRNPPARGNRRSKSIQYVGCARSPSTRIHRDAKGQNTYLLLTFV